MKKTVVRKFVSMMVVLGMVLTIAACGNSSTTNKEGSGGDLDFSLGAGSQGGVYYPVGVGIAEILNNNMDGITVTPEVTGASLENVVLLGNNEVEIGISTVGDLVLAAEGKEPFKKELDNLSILNVGLKPGAVQVLTLKENGIDSIEDLKGKRVSVGPQGGGGWKAFSEILPYYDMTLEDIEASYLSYGDSIGQLTDGMIDATVITAGLPTPAVMQLAAEEDFAVIPFDEDKLNKFLDEHKYYAKVTIKSSLYKGMTEDVNTYATVNAVVIRDDISEDVVYEINKTLFENLDKLREAHPSLKQLDIEMAAAYKGFKYHPGSVKYFKEQGIEVPAE
jgi:uncharacterized protein